MTRAEAIEDMKADFDKRMLEARMARDWFSPNHPRYDYWDGVIDDLIAEKNELTEPERQAEEIRADAEWLGTGSEDKANVQFIEEGTGNDPALVTELRNQGW